MVIELGNKTLSRQEDQRFPSGKFHYSWERNGPQASRSAFLVFGLFSAICCSLCALSFLCSLLSIAGFLLFKTKTKGSYRVNTSYFIFLNMIFFIPQGEKVSSSASVDPEADLFSTSFLSGI